MAKRKGRKSRRMNGAVGCLALILLVVIILLMRQLPSTRTQAVATRMNTATITLIPTMSRATSTPRLQSTMPATAIIAPAQAQSPFGCNQQDDLNCTDFRAIGQNANAHLAMCGDEDRLDQDGDGRACELN